MGRGSWTGRLIVYPYNLSLGLATTTFTSHIWDSAILKSITIIFLLHLNFFQTGIYICSWVNHPSNRLLSFTSCVEVMHIAIIPLQPSIQVWTCIILVSYAIFFVLYLLSLSAELVMLIIWYFVLSTLYCILLLLYENLSLGYHSFSLDEQNIFSLKFAFLEDYLSLSLFIFLKLFFKNLLLLIVLVLQPKNLCLEILHFLAVSFLLCE